MKKLNFLVSLCLLFPALSVEAAPITYTVDLTDRSNASLRLVGQITTSGNLGVIQPGDISDWSFELGGMSGPFLPLSISSADPGSLVCPSAGCFEATLTGLFPVPGSVAFYSGTSQILFGYAPSNPAFFRQLVQVQNFGSPFPLFTSVLPDKSAFASVPEPGALGLVLAAFGAFAATVFARRSRIGVRRFSTVAAA